MERDDIILKLKERLNAAKERRDEASERFDEAIKLPSGLPYPDSYERIRQASAEYRDALKEVLGALDALNRFMTHGTVPDGTLPDGAAPDGRVPDRTAARLNKAQ